MDIVVAIRTMTDKELADYMHEILANVTGKPETCPSIFLSAGLDKKQREMSDGD